MLGVDQKIRKSCYWTCTGKWLNMPTTFPRSKELKIGVEINSSHRENQNKRWKTYQKKKTRAEKPLEQQSEIGSKVE